MLRRPGQEPDPVFLFEHATLYPLEGELDETAPRVAPAGRRSGESATP